MGTSGCWLARSAGYKTACGAELALLTQDGSEHQKLLVLTCGDVRAGLPSCAAFIRLRPISTVLEDG